MWTKTGHPVQPLDELGHRVLAVPAGSRAVAVRSLVGAPAWLAHLRGGRARAAEAAAHRAPLSRSPCFGSRTTQYGVCVLPQEHAGARSPRSEPQANGMVVVRGASQRLHG